MRFIDTASFHRAGSLYDAAVKTPLLLAETDLLLCAGIVDAVRRSDVWQIHASVRSQASLEDAMQTSDAGLAVIAWALVQSMTRLGQIAGERQCRLVLLLREHEEPPWEYLPLVHGVLFRNATEDTLLQCLQAVANGDVWGAQAPGMRKAPRTPGERVLSQLSDRQILVVAGVARGDKNAAIAQRLHTTEQVIKNMLGSIYDLAGVSDRLELTLFVLHHPELALATQRVAQRSIPDLP